MYLQNLLKLIRRRWLFFLVPFAAMLAVGIITYDAPQPVHTVGLRFIVGQPPYNAADLREEDRYYSWVTSEYIVAAVADWASGTQFPELVADRLAADGVEVSPNALQAQFSVERVRSMLTFSVTTWPDEAETEQIMLAVIDVLANENQEMLPILGDYPAEIVPIDVPRVDTIPPAVTDQLSLFMRVGAAITAGLAGVFLAEWFRPTFPRTPRKRPAVDSAEPISFTVTLPRRPNLPAILRWVMGFLRRRWWMLVIPPLIAAGLYFNRVLRLELENIDKFAGVDHYVTELAFAVGNPPFSAELNSAADSEEAYYAWLESQYTVAAITDWASGSQFALLVNERLAAKGLPQFDMEKITDIFTTGAARSQFFIAIRESEEERVLEIAEAAREIVIEQNGTILPQTGGEPVNVVFNSIKPLEFVGAPSRITVNELRYRMLVALRTGLLLAIAVELLDPTIRTRRQAESSIDIPLLAEIPAQP